MAFSDYRTLWYVSLVCLHSFLFVCLGSFCLVLFSFGVFLSRFIDNKQIMPSMSVFCVTTESVVWGLKRGSRTPRRNVFL